MSRRVRVHLWPQSYAIARLQDVPAAFPGDGPDGSPVSLTVGHGEISLIAPEALVDGLSETVEVSERGWRAITLDVVLPFEVVGVLAAITAALMQIRVPVIAISSHDTDHLLVRAEHLGRALAALNQVALEDLLPQS